jgi:threonine dehydratase
MSTQVAFEDIAAAAQRLRGQARETAVIEVPGALPSGGTLVVKAECLQIGGAFKFRGAYNRLVQLDERGRAGGVVAFSSGNHAQGVAAAARRLGISATIVMPKDAPAIKVEQTKSHGASVVFYDRFTEDRAQIARSIAEKSGATLVPPYDDPHIIAGQGTTALELCSQLEQRGSAPLDILLVPCGGGGLTAGCALAMERLSPRTRVYCVEPAEFDDTARSLASGKFEKVKEGARSICDALQPFQPGALTFPINQRLLAGGLTVTDDMVLAAMKFAWRDLKLVVEPGGSAGLAAALHDRVACAGKRVGVVLSGGNVDPALYKTILS